MLIASNLLPRGVGERKLAALFAIESDPRRWTVEKFDNVPGWGTASIDELLYALPAALEWGKFRGVVPLAKVAPLETQPTNGKSVVFTGVRDKVLEERLKAQGWEISPSVTKKTTMVVVADSWNGENSGKTQKAKEYGVRIMSISEFSTSN
jgi:NAD-dependent DNA ligase